MDKETDRQSEKDRTKRPKTGKQIDYRQTYNIHPLKCTNKDRLTHRQTVYLVAGGLSSAQSILVMALRQAQL